MGDKVEATYHPDLLVQRDHAWMARMFGTPRNRVTNPNPDSRNKLERLWAEYLDDPQFKDKRDVFDFMEWALPQFDERRY